MSFYDANEELEETLVLSERILNQFNGKLTLNKGGVTKELLSFCMDANIGSSPVSPPPNVATFALNDLDINVAHRSLSKKPSNAADL